MTSPFERAIVRLQVFSDGKTLSNLLEQYFSSKDLLTLRLTSRSFSRVRGLNEQALKTVYIHTPLPPGRNQDLVALERIATCCHHLIIKIAFPPGSTLPTTSFSSPPSTPESSDTITDVLDLYHKQEQPSPVAWKFFVQRNPRQIDRDLLAQWHHIFNLLPNLRILTIACNGDPSWPGCTDIEALLIILRICIERTNPKHLVTMRLAPIHAMGIVHLRWSGLGAFGEVDTANDSVWHRLKTLEIQAVNPYIQGRLSTSQKAMFGKVFLDYLTSFRRGLERLELGWLGEEGPNPFEVGVRDEKVGVRAQRVWGRLEVLGLRGVRLDDRGIRGIGEMAPGLKDFSAC